MQVLKFLSIIWKSGATIYLKEDDVHIDHGDNIPADAIKAGEIIFEDIKAWLNSWEGANGIDQTMQKMIHQACGWQHNPKLNEWICTDVDSLMLFMEWQETLAKNGWNDIYTDYRQYENEASNVLKKKLYEHAVLYANQNK